jgi:hypothetical protein
MSGQPDILAALPSGKEHLWIGGRVGPGACLDTVGQNKIFRENWTKIDENKAARTRS